MVTRTRLHSLQAGDPGLIPNTTVPMRIAQKERQKEGAWEEGQTKMEKETLGLV